MAQTDNNGQNTFDILSTLNEGRDVKLHDQYMRIDKAQINNQHLTVNHNYFIRCCIVTVAELIIWGIFAGLISAGLLAMAAVAQQHDTTGIGILYGAALIAPVVYLVIFFTKIYNLKNIHETVTKIEDLRVKNSFHSLSNRESEED